MDDRRDGVGEQMTYVLARTAGGRPALQHKTDDHDVTLCGLDITGWSRAYTRTPIKEILCKKCGKAELANG